MKHRIRPSLAAALALLPWTLPTPAASQSRSLRDSFRIGSGGGVLCSAQTSSTDAALKDMFDRAYAVVCRDAAVPVGHLYALKNRGESPASRLAALRAEKAECGPAGGEAIDGIGQVQAQSWRMTGPYVGSGGYTWRAGVPLSVAEGLSGNESAR